MSHPLYNPYASGNQSSTQGQYGLSSIQADPRRAPPHHGPVSGFSSAGASSATPANSGGLLSSLLPQTMSYRPDQGRAIMDDNIERSIDMHISRAREEVRLLGNPMHQPRDQGPRFTGTQRDEFLSSGTGMTSYTMASTSAPQALRPTGVESTSSSLDWSSNYKKPTSDDHYQFYSSSASSNYASSDNGRFNASSERERDVASIPGLGGGFDYSAPDKPAAPTESSRPKYTSESASNILVHFGLEKEDLEQLISYPEDQITPANLPFILRQIRIEKTKRATAEAQSKPQPPRTVSGMDSHSLSSSGGPRMRQEQMSSAVSQPSKVIDYGHTGKYTGGVGDEIGRTSGSRANSGGSGSMTQMDTYDSSRHGRELFPKNATEVKSSALGSSRDQTSSVSGLSSSYGSLLSSVAPTSNDQTNRLQNTPNQTSQTILSSFSLPKKDTDIRVLKSEPPTPIALNEPQAARQLTLKTQPPSTLYRGVHPSRPGLVLIGSNEASGTKDQSKTRGSTVAEQMEKQQSQQQPLQQMQKQRMQKQRMQPTQKQQMQKRPMQKQQMQKRPMQKQQMQQQQPVSLMGQATWPPVFSAAKSAASASHNIPSILSVMQRPGGPCPIPAAVPQPIPGLMNLIPLTMPPSSKQHPAKRGVSKDLPTAAMMHDYAAATPRIFPHTCCLCNKECTQMKDWISHQNTSLHLENCKLLRKQYPVWDGEIAVRPSAAGKDAKPSPKTGSQTFQHRQKARHGSRSSSRSPSPRRHGSEGRREKRSSPSRSPHSSRHARRSRSRSSSPRYNRPTSSRFRSRSRSRSSPRRDEKRSSPRRRDDRRPSPRRSRETRASPRRSNERGSSPRRSRETRSPPRRGDERRSPPRRSDDRRSPPRRSDPRRLPQRKNSNSAESLAKKLMETSAVKSLSKHSDLEAVVKTLAPALLAELAKLKSSSPSPSSSTGGKSFIPFTSKKRVTKKPNQASSSMQTKSEKYSTPTTVKLQGIDKSVSHNDLSLVVEQFGKTESVVLFRFRHEAIVRFEKEEDAKKLKSIKNFSVKGMTVTVVREKETVSREQKKPLQKKPATSSVSTPLNTGKVLLPTPTMSLPKGLKKPLPSGAKKAATGKLTNQKGAAKGAVKGLTTATKAKVLVSKAKNISTKQGTKMGKTGKVPAKGAVKKTLVKQKTSSASESTAPEKQPGEEHSNPQESETVLQEAEPRDAANEAEKGIVTDIEPKQEEVDKANDAEDAKPMEIAEMGVEVAEPMDVGSCPELSQEEKPTTTETVPEDSADKSSEDPPPNITEEPTETALHVQQRTSSEPECTAQAPETIAEASHMHQQAAGSPTVEEKLPEEGVEAKLPEGGVEEKLPEGGVEAKLPEGGVEEKLPEGGVEAKTIQKGPVAEEKTPTDAAPVKKASKDNAGSKLTIGEKIEKHLFRYKIKTFHIRAESGTPLYSVGKKQLLITNLPEYYDGCYTEDDIAHRLKPFGFNFTDETIYVVPQARMAIVLLPTMEDVMDVVKASMWKGLALKGSKLNCYAIAAPLTMTRLGFYKTLMGRINFKVDDDGGRIVLIKNISWSDAWKLRETLKDISCYSVRNFLPLLNKVFIEFRCNRDVDRLGVWFSQKEAPGHQVHRLNNPNIKGTVPPLASAVKVPAELGPFWVTLRTHPFLFPVSAPYFLIPDHLTVRGPDDIAEVSDRDSMFPTIMLTGLPEGDYRHEDVAKSVQQYFPEQSLESLHYNVAVLPLQKRAFVFFADWTACCAFARDHISNPVSVEGCALEVHFVLEQILPASSEEMMYTTLMKLSNGVPEPESLQERLLCVQVTDMSTDIICALMEMVESVATFVNCLPLANRIFIEMADFSGVTKVLKKHKTYKPDTFRKRKAWYRVGLVESLKTRQERLQKSSEITSNFEENTIHVKAEPLPSELSDNGSQPSLQPGVPDGPGVSKPITPRDVEMKEDGENPGTEMDSVVKREEEAVTASTSTPDVTSAVSAGSTAPSATALRPEKTFADLPQISTEAFQVLKAAVRSRRPRRPRRSHRELKESRQKRTSGTVLAGHAPQTKRQDDFTDDGLPSDFYLFEEQDLNLDDFVTVDEVGDDDAVDSRHRPHSSSSSSQQSSRARGERPSSGVSSADRCTLTKYLKDSRSAPSSSHSSKSTRGSRSSSSASPKKSKASSEPTKSPTKPSASVSRASSSSSSSLSTETSSSPGQKTQQSKTKSPTKASNTASSSCGTRSSSAACEPEKITSAATVEASMETHSEPLREEVKATESAVAMSDHTVSAEGIAAKSVESETEIETSSEMHPPVQGHGLELSQAQTLEDEKKSKEEGKEGDVDKHAKVEEDGGDILDQTDEQRDGGDRDCSSEAQLTEPEEGQPLESSQVLDSVDEEGKAQPQEMEMENSLQLLDSVATDQAATGHLVQNDSSTVNQLSEEEAITAGDKSDKDQEDSNVDSSQVLETGREQAPVQMEDGMKSKEDEDAASNDVENPEIPHEDQTLPDNRACDDDVTEVETFEILDSIDEQTATEEENLETPSEQISKEEARPVEEEEDTYEVIDSVEDQPMTTEAESESDNRNTRKDDRPSNNHTTRASRSEEKEKSPNKQDRAAKRHETRTKMDTTAGVSKKDKEVTEEIEYKIVDSVEEEPVQNVAATETPGRRRSARGKKEDKITLDVTEVSEKPEEATYEILDSVEDEPANDEPAATRSTRGKRGRATKKDASNELTKKEDTPTRRRHTPARESQERNREQTPKKDEKEPPKEIKKEDAPSEVFHSVEEELAKDRPATKRKRGRPKKEVKTTKKDSAALKKTDKDASEKVADEEEATYRILDSVEEETSDYPPPKEEKPKNDEQQTEKSAPLAGTPEEEEEEPMYQIVDSLEDDQAQEEPLASEVSETSETNGETPAKEETSAEQGETCSTTDVGTSEKVEEALYEIVDDLDESNDDPTAAGTQESTPKTDKSQSDAARLKKKNKKSPEKDDTTSTLVNLDEVSEEEEDYPDDAAEEEELRKRQAAAKEKQVTKEREARRSREREERRTRERGERERRSRSSRGGGTRRAKEREETLELVTLDEVGADEDRDGGMTEGELQALVTLDEFVEEEDGKAEQSTPETRPLSQDESEDFLHPETLVTLDEAGDDEEEKPDEEEALRSAKRKHGDDTEDSMNFVTVDEVGEVEEEAVKTRTRGQAKKRARQTPVRKSTRGKNPKEEGEEEPAGLLPPTPLAASSSLDKGPSMLSSQPEIQQTEAVVEAASPAPVDAASAGQELQPELPENPALEGGEEEGEVEERSREDIKVASKQRREPVGPKPKRSRSQSPCVAADVQLPPFKPNTPLGQDFVVPKSGFFCNLCSMFYLNERTARDLHCSSQRHYDNLQKHYQKQKPSGPAQSSQGSVSD